LKDADADPITELDDFTKTANVYDPPTIDSDDIDGPYPAGVPQNFDVTVNNPTTGGNFVNSIYYVFTIADAVKANFISLQCYFDTTPTDILALMSEENGNLVGRVGYGSAGFPMPPSGVDITTSCTLNAATAGNYDFTVSMVDYPFGTPPSDRVIASFSAEAEVTGSLDIAGTFSMQGRVPRGGIPVIFTLTTPAYSKQGLTTNVLGLNFNLSVDYTGTYAITTNQARYLNLTSASGKTIVVNGDKQMAPLMLRGGDVVQDGEIKVGDASLIGTNYGQSGENNADANFDLRVNIQDLAMVGGNFGLTSANAYTGWSPLP